MGDSILKINVKGKTFCSTLAHRTLYHPPVSLVTLFRINLIWALRWYILRNISKTGKNVISWAASQNVWWIPAAGENSKHERTTYKRTTRLSCDTWLRDRLKVFDNLRLSLIFLKLSILFFPSYSFKTLEETCVQHVCVCVYKKRYW